MAFGTIPMRKNNIIKKTDKNIKTVLRFDSGKRDFTRMIYVLLAGAMLVLIFGGYFLWDLYR